MLEKALLFALAGISLCYENSTVATCLWHINSCVDLCPEWLVKVESACTKTYWHSQRTCEHPNAVLVGTACGLSRCDCPEPAVLDTSTGYCCALDDCPINHAV